MKVLVTGGAGYIGSHTVLALLEAGHDVVIIDDFRNSKRSVMPRLTKLSGREIPLVEASVTDEAALEALFATHRPEAVVHFAALKAVGESVAQPLRYYENNLVSTLTLARVMEKHGVRKFVFSSSATVYGDPDEVPIREAAALRATNPYGWTKLMNEQMLRDLVVSDPRWQVALLRYFNPIGAHLSGEIGEDPSGIPNNLLPYVAQVAIGKRPKLSVFGGDYGTTDGTGVRDYIHVVDLARGHVAALEHLPTSGKAEAYNLGTGQGYSVLEVVRAFEKASGRKVPYEVVARRPGDIASCFADPARARNELKWKAELPLERMCEDSWRWQSQNPEGFPE